MNVLAPKTYELPTCTICLEDLADALSVTSCGHVFHTLCILRNLEYRTICPNCKERTSLKQLKEIHYTVGVTKEQDKDRVNFLESLKQADQENYLNLITKNDEMYKELRQTKEKVKDLQENISNKEVLLSSQGEMIRNLNKEKNDIQNENRGLFLQKEALQLENEKLTKKIRELAPKIGRLEEEIKEFDKIQKVMNMNPDSEDSYLKDLRDKAPVTEQAKTFYEFLRMKKGDLKKAKEELQRYAVELQKKNDKIKALEAALKSQKMAAAPVPMKQREREERRSLMMQPAATSSITKEVSKLNLESLGEDFLNEAYENEERSSTQNIDPTQIIEEVETSKKENSNSSRIIRTIIPPKGIQTKPSQPIKFSNNFANVLKNREAPVVDLKRVKLNSDMAFSNVQQKLSFGRKF